MTSMLLHPIVSSQLSSHPPCQQYLVTPSFLKHRIHLASGTYFILLRTLEQHPIPLRMKAKALEWLKRPSLIPVLVTLFFQITRKFTPSIQLKYDLIVCKSFPGTQSKITASLTSYVPYQKFNVIIYVVQLQIYLFSISLFYSLTYPQHLQQCQHLVRIQVFMELTE